MDSENKKKGIPFKIFLDKSTNLVTIFGVLNALFIYTNTIENKDVASFLLPSFFMLSLLVWFELIFFALKSNDGSRKYEFFYFLACAIEIGLIWYFITIFTSLLLQLVLFGILMLFTLLSVLLFMWLLSKPLSKIKKNTRELIIMLLLIVSILIAGVIMELSKPILKPIFYKIYPEKSKSDLSYK